MTLLEARQHLATLLEANYADIVAGQHQLFTVQNLTDAINFASLRVWDLHPWNFTEGVKTFTPSAEEYTVGYFDYPLDIVDGSIHTLQVAGVEFKKLIFRDYQKLLSEDSAADDKVWTEINRQFFINKNAYSAGEVVDLHGKKIFTPLSQDSDLLPFSPSQDNYEYSGNQAIVRLAYADILASEKMREPQKAELEERKGQVILAGLWKQFSENRGHEQSTSRPMFKSYDFFAEGGAQQL